ncbi:MAG: AAC(3) family N-acetyltransferase [Lentisphaeria bacterium]|nr:AAC(3) family N-acetyltransferase [Lentisphaeria bacterium]
MLKRTELEKSLQNLGIKKGGVVLLHSSVVALGPVEGGPEGIIQAFLNVLGPKGTLVVPVFGKLGILTELVRNWKGAVVSDAPVGTLAAVGAKAKSLLADHLKAATAHGEGSPYDRIAKAGGQICLLGVDMDRNTMLHSVEAWLDLPYLRTVETTSLDAKGKSVTRKWPCYPGPHRDFIGLDSLLRLEGISAVARIGNAQVRLIDAQAMMDTLLEVGQDDPAFALCINPACADCVSQRAAIAKSIFAKESFHLAAAASLCGRYVPEMVENLKAAGLEWIELDFIQGKAAAYLPAAKLQAAVAELKENGIGISALRLPAFPADWEKRADDWAAAGITRVIAPLAAALPEAEKVFKKLKIQLDFVNTGISSETAKALLATATKGRKDPRAFVFNPAEFALAGEHPFLGSWRIGRFIHTISQLDMADALWDGTPAKFAQGNGEVLEMLSILRCGNFNGFVVLGGGHKYPGTLAEAVAQFRDAIE